MPQSIRTTPSLPAAGRRRSRRPRRALVGLALSAAFALLHPADLRADYVFKPLGTMGYLTSEPIAINDVGQVCGTLTGT